MKRHLSRISFLGLLTLVACGGSEPRPVVPPVASSVAPAAPAASSSESAPAPARPAPEKLTSDSPRTTASGATFTAPAGWTIESDGPRTLLTGPENDLHLVILDSPAPSAEDAVAAAWHALRPDFKRPLKLTTPKPGRDGWDERKDYDYETSPNEKVVAWASAARHGSSWLARPSHGVTG